MTTIPQSPRHPRRVLAIAAAGWTIAWAVLGSLSDWGAYWICWIAFGAIVPECYGLLFNAAATLSRQTWGLEHLDMAHPLDFAEWTPMHYAVALALWILFAWLSVHLPLGWIRLSAPK